VPSSENKVRRSYDRKATEAALLESFEEVLMRDGLQQLSVSSIAENALVDRALIYRYFDGLEGLAGSWAKSTEFWPPDLELIGDDVEAFSELSVHDRIKTVIVNYIDGIRKRPLTAQMLIAELLNPNQISEALEKEAAVHGEGIGAYIQPDINDPVLMERTWQLIVLVRSITFYWCIRANHNPDFLGMDLREEESWDFLKNAVNNIIDAYLPPT